MRYCPSTSLKRLHLRRRSGMGVFEWDVRADIFTGENPEAYRIFGRTPAQPKLSMADFVGGYVHPDDGARLQRQLGQAMRPGERFATVFRARQGAAGRCRRCRQDRRR